jgi:hypothetical protein
MPVLLGERKRHQQERLWATVALALGLAVLAGLLVMRYGRETSATTSTTAPAAARRPDGRAEISGRPRNGSDASQPARTAEPSAAQPASDTLTDVEAVLAAPDPGAVDGRKAEFASVTVRRILSDRAFTIGEQAGRELVVLLDGRLDAKMAEDQARVKPGMRLRMAGRVERPPSPDVAQERYGGLSVRESAALRGQTAYMHAEALGAVR